MGDNEKRADVASKQSVFLGYRSAVESGEPKPPYTAKLQDFIYIGTEFDPDMVREVLPAGLEPLDDNSGVIGMYSAKEGWGLTPFTATFVGIAVKGPASPDGSPPVFMARGFYSDRGGRMLHNNYNRRFERGGSNVRWDGSCYVGEAIADWGTPIRVKVRPRFEDQGPPTSGMHYYIGTRDDGALNIWSIAFTGSFVPADLEELELFNDPRQDFLKLRPRSISFACYWSEVPSTFSAPRLYDPSDDSGFAGEVRRVALLDLLSRMGHAAALVARDGRLLFATQSAQGLLSSTQPGARLSVWRRRDQGALVRALEQTGSGGVQVSEAVSIERPDGQLPVVARALPVSAALAGEDAVLVLFRDLDAKGDLETSSVLQVLGLTPAEARLAAAVGEGHSVKLCADTLGITESTARSTLKIVYSKLGIGKQTELAGIVARLG